MDEIIITHAQCGAYNSMSKSHSHREYEITYLFNGSRKYFVRNDIFMANDKSFVFMNKYVLHKTNFGNDEEYERLSIYFTDEYIDGEFDAETAAQVRQLFDLPLLEVPPGNVKYVENLLIRAENEYQLKKKYSSKLIKIYISELIIYFLRTRMTISAQKIDIGNASADFTHKVSQYVIQNYKRRLTLGEVAKYMHMSPNWFSTRFKSVTGMGFHEYLIRVRIQHSCELLTGTDMSITEIAFECGFNESSYFGGVFKKMIGQSPRSYRVSQRTGAK